MLKVYCLPIVFSYFINLKVFSQFERFRLQLVQMVRQNIQFQNKIDWQ